MFRHDEQRTYNYFYRKVDMQYLGILCHWGTADAKYGDACYGVFFNLKNINIEPHSMLNEMFAYSHGMFDNYKEYQLYKVRQL